MPERKTRAVFYRGGTSKAVMFRSGDLPPAAEDRDRLLLNVLGSPDPYGRQLNGLGGGVSSLSKALWVERSRRNDADIDYTFAQIAVDAPVVDYAANCGNMSSAVAPFAVEEGIFPVDDGEAMVRMYNVNTDKCVHAHFAVEGGRAVTEGDTEIPGVPGTGAPVRLDFLDPGGTVGKGLLPTGAAQETVETAGFGAVPVSVVDAAVIGAFVPAENFGLTGAEPPEEIEARGDVMAALDDIRREAAVRVGMCESPVDAPLAAPRIALVAAPARFTALDGRTFEPDSFDIAVRMVSMGKIHRAVMVTGAMCLAAAAAVEGAVPNTLATGTDGEGRLRIGNPSGVTPAAAAVSKRNGAWHAASTSALRTCRRLMEGFVYHP